MEQNIGSAMAQIGVQFSLLFDELERLAEVIKSCGAAQASISEDIIKSRLSTITAESSPEDVRMQQQLAAEILNSAAAIAEQFPDIKTDESYIKCIGAIESCSKMIDTGCLIYNDSVHSFNNELSAFSRLILCRVMGIRRRKFIEINQTVL